MIEINVRESGKVWFGVANTPHLIFATAFAGTKPTVIRYLLGKLPFDVPFEVASECSPLAERTLSLMEAVYAGEDVNTEHVRLAYEQVKPYTRTVLQTVLQIPLGFVASYGAVAKVAGGGARAVGNAMAANPFPPLVPCHRVVNSNFKLGGYSGGGIDVKLEMLKRERKGYTKPKKISVRERTLQVFPVEFVLNEDSKVLY